MTKRAVEGLVRGLRDESDVRLGQVAAETRRPSFEVSAGTAAGELLEEVLDQVLLGQLLDQLHLLDADRDLARDRASELDSGAALGDEQPDELTVRDERDRESPAPPSPYKLGTELGESERPARASWLGIACATLELLAPRVEEIDVAGTGSEERASVRDDDVEQLVERVRARDLLGELAESLELGDAQLRLLVQASVVDRRRDERRRGD